MAAAADAEAVLQPDEAEVLHRYFREVLVLVYGEDGAAALPDAFVEAERAAFVQLAEGDSVFDRAAAGEWPETIEQLGLDPMEYDVYIGRWVDAWTAIEMAEEDAAVNEVCAEADWLEGMAEHEAMIGAAIERGEMSEEAGSAAISEIEEEVARFRADRGYDQLSPWPRLVGDLVLRVRAVYARRGSTRAPRGRRVRSRAASRDGPLPSSDDPPDPPGVTAPLEGAA
jgi:hypothetical protein